MQKQCRALLLLSACLLSALTFGCKKAEIRGLVKSLADQPISDVRVSIPNSTHTAATNGDGKYAIPYAPGSFTVKFEKEGYIAQTLQLSLATKAPFDAEAVTMPMVLSADEARRLIIQRKGWPVRLRTVVDLDVHTQDLPKNALLQSYMRQGLLQIRHTSQNPPYTVLEPTEKGRAYYIERRSFVTGRYDPRRIGYDTEAYVEACKEDLGEITGISHFEDGSEASVTFHSVYKNPTPFVDAGGYNFRRKAEECRSGKTTSYTATFRYENGWRIAEVNQHR